MNTIDVYFKGLFVWGKKEKEGKWGSKNHIFLFLCLGGIQDFPFRLTYFLLSESSEKLEGKCVVWSGLIEMCLLIDQTSFFNFDWWSIFLNRLKSKFSWLILKIYFFNWLKIHFLSSHFSFYPLFLPKPNRT